MLKSLSFSRRLDHLLRANQQSLLRHGLKGLEKESLRISTHGRIALTPHPSRLGSALTHPWITTDYSEALIELITPPSAAPEEALGFLADLHAFVHAHLEDEVLLATSMPIGLKGDESIPIARYGHSNIGQMKHVYRRGLGYRYGRTMQAIAGVHFNYSVNEDLWPILQDCEQDSATADDYIARAYFGLIRNVHRLGWLLIYLFGHSPAICTSFFHGRESLSERFSAFDRDTLYRPFATSLRMSDIGYRNDNQTRLDISFDSLDNYVNSLAQAIEQPYPPYADIGIKVNGEYRQLNANILQIENEYYSSIRPKQIAHSGEKPTLALKKRGVRYVELRSLDLMSFAHEGVSLDQMRFLEVFLLLCLMLDSAPLGHDEKAESSQNNLNVACCGRGPNFSLLRQGKPVQLRQWAREILDRMADVAACLDEGTQDAPYTQSILSQRSAVDDPEMTPSARVLRDMRTDGMSFAEFALNQSSQHARHWRAHRLDRDRQQAFEKATVESWTKQQQIEQSDTLSFDAFLQAYWSQS